MSKQDSAVPHRRGKLIGLLVPEKERANLSAAMMHSTEELAGPMTRLTLQSKPWEGTLINEVSTLQLASKLHARSSSSDSRRGSILRVRKNSDSEVSYFAPEEEAEKSNSKDLRSSIGNSVMAHLLIHQSRHLTRSTLEKSPNQWAKPARSVVFDDFPHDSMEAKMDEGAEMEDNWTPVMKKKKKLRDRRVSMNSDEGVSRGVGLLCPNNYPIVGWRLELVVWCNVWRYKVSALILAKSSFLIQGLLE